MYSQLKLRQQAKIDYQQARGTAHKNLLQAAFKELKQQQKSHQQTIRLAQARISQLQNTQTQELRESLLHHLVQDRLTEIPGIGQKRKAEILQKVYKGKLTDLRQAHQLPGIGAQTQIAINQWVNYHQQNFPNELKKNFPGKEHIQKIYQAQIHIEEDKMATVEESLLTLQEQGDRIRLELAWLEKISVKEFHRTLRKPGNVVPKLDRYVQGIFAEWEPMPDWFQNVLITANVSLPKKARGRRSPVSPGFITPHSQSASSNSSPDARLPTTPSFLTFLQNSWQMILLTVVGGIFFVCFGCAVLMALTISFDNPAIPTLAPTITVKPSATVTNRPTSTATSRATAIPQPNRQMRVTLSPSATIVTVATATMKATVATTSQPMARVDVGSANVRIEPEITAVIVAVVLAGDILPVLGATSDESWFLVELPDGREGWIGSSVVTYVTTNSESQ